MVTTTQGIVIRNIKYGDTSLICSIFTRDFGLQSYMIKGVRSARAKTAKANILFPGAVLDLVIYRYPGKEMNYVKEYHLTGPLRQGNDSVIKNCILTFAVELMANILTDHQEHEDVFDLYTELVGYLGAIRDKEAANTPLSFIIQVTRMAGYSIGGAYSGSHPYIDIAEGRFSREHTAFTMLDEQEAAILSDLLQCSGFIEAQAVVMSNQARRNILNAYLSFLQYHAPGFRELKCIPVLHAVLS